MGRSPAPATRMPLFSIQYKKGLSTSTDRKFSSTGEWGNPSLSMAYSSSDLRAVMTM